jgi:DNA-binding transcriptional ArsR family regulator
MHPLDQTFGALSDPTRRAILAQLTTGECALSKLAEPFDLSQTAISKHVRVLEQASLVHIEKRGRTRYCRLQSAPIQAASRYLGSYEQFWMGQLDALGQYLQPETP